MTEKHRPKKRKFLCGGNPPITPITAKRSQELDRRLQNRREKLRARYPEVHGRVVDYISHSIDDGILFFNVAFKDKTLFSLRFACEMFIVGADFMDTRTGDLVEVLREYAKPVLR